MKEEFSPLSYQVIGAAIEVHRALGPGLLESVYKQCLAIELRERAISFATEVPVPVKYKGHIIPNGYRADLLVERQLIVEVKSVMQLVPVYQSQTLTYMKLLHATEGLLLNFWVSQLRDGIKRLVLTQHHTEDSVAAPRNSIEPTAAQGAQGAD